FAAAGKEQGMNLYLRQDVPAGTLVAVKVTGTAPSGGGGAESAPQGREAQDAGAESGSATIQAVPGRLDAMKWPLLGGFAVVFGVLAYLLSRKQVVAVAAGEAAAGVAPAAGKAKKPKAQPPVAAGQTPSVATAAPLAPAVPAAK